MPQLRIPRSILDAAMAHAREAMPHECCGMMAGQGGTVSELIRLGNSRPSPVSYEISASDQLRAMKQIESSGLELVAIYHSHPASEAYPSGIDIERAFFPGTREPNYPGAAYVIVGMTHAEPVVRAFKIEVAGISEIAIETLAEK